MNFCYVFTVTAGLVMYIPHSDAMSQKTDEEASDYADALQILQILQKQRRVSPLDASFSWEDCGSSSSLVHVGAVSLKPEPLKLPGNVSLGFTADVSADLSKVVSLDLTIQKKIAFIWVTVPCINNIGSCSYDNICPTSTKFCPPSFLKYGIPCQCPVKKGTYTLPSSPVTVNVGGVPFGNYRVTAKLRSGNISVGCLYVEASIG